MSNYINEIIDIVILSLDLPEPLIGILDLLVARCKFYICLLLEGNISNNTEKYWLMSSSFFMDWRDGDIDRSLSLIFTGNRHFYRFKFILMDISDRRGRDGRKKKSYIFTLHFFRFISEDFSSSSIP